MYQAPPPWFNGLRARSAARGDPPSVSHRRRRRARVSGRRVGSRGWLSASLRDDPLAARAARIIRHSRRQRHRRMQTFAADESGGGAGDDGATNVVGGPGQVGVVVGIVIVGAELEHTEPSPAQSRTLSGIVATVPYFSDEYFFFTAASEPFVEWRTPCMSLRQACRSLSAYCA